MSGPTQAEHEAARARRQIKVGLQHMDGIPAKQIAINMGVTIWTIYADLNALDLVRIPRRRLSK